MTNEQAEEVVLLLSAATGGRSDEPTKNYFHAALLPLHYETALSAATTGTTIWRFFPSWAEFKEVYRAQDKLREPAGEQRSELPPVATKEKVLPWVKRWIAARYYYERFGKERDLRPFKESHPDASRPPYGEEWMPDDAWVAESEHISDKDIRAVGH